MKNVFIILALLFVKMSVTAQTVKDAEVLFNEGRYEESMTVYESLMKKSTRDHMLKYKAARCLIKLARYEESIPLLEYAAKKNVRKANYYLYDAYFNTYRFEKAMEALNKYIELRGDMITDMVPYDIKLEKANMGQRMLERVDEVTITDSTKIGKRQFLEVYRLPVDLGKLEQKCVHIDSTDEVCMVKYFTGREDKMITAKRNESGNLDLDVSYHLVDGWSRETSLSDVLNTESDENYPFELPDGVTLYFASNGHGSLGGYDIFLTRYNANSNDYSVPINIGMPFNSPANDYMLVYDEIAQVGWFATDRGQSKDTVVVYEFLPNQEKMLIDTDDTELRRLTAQLKLYKKGEKHKFKLGNRDKVHKEKENEINFMINDGIVYTQLEQFISRDARSMFLELQGNIKKLLDQKQLLDKKRKEFGTLKNGKEKEMLIEEILIMEQEIKNVQKMQDDNILNIRIAEIEALKNKKDKK